jgi:exopolysaccharide production protein ExoY
MSTNPGFICYERRNASVIRSIDFALIVAGYLLATGFAGILTRWHIFRYPSPEEWWALPMTLLPIMLISWSVVSGYSDTYASHRDESLPHVALHLLRTIGLWAVVSLGAVFLAKLKYSSRQFTLEFILCAGALIIMRQLVAVLFLRRLRQSGYDQRTALVLGDKASCERFVTQANLSHPKEYQFIPVTVAPTGVIGDENFELAKSVTGDEIFIIGGSLSLESQDNPALRFLTQGKSVHIVPELIDASLFRQTLGEIAGMPVLSISHGRLTWLEKFAKRALDLACALFLLVLSAPVWIVTAVLVKLTSPGPVLFRQKRLGKDGQPFIMAKFRTMRCDAEHELMCSPELYKRYLTNNYKLPASEDPRLTTIGGFLRALSIDELPQLVNVVRGEMSLVGPRPILPAEIENYGEFASLFLSAKPGITGHWQVSGRSEIREYRRRVELDLEYIRDQSIRTDLDILLRTIPTVLRRKGAY